MKLFISGQSAPADFAGVAAARLPIGVQIQEVSGTVVEKIIDYTSKGGEVFIDSGVFSCFMENLKRKKRNAETGGNEPMLSVDFPEVLEKYERVAAATTRPECLLAVAPDEIGDQERTAELQRLYLDRVKQLARRGVEVLVPFQRGWALDQYQEHYEFLRQELGPFTVAIAANKEAWAPRDVAKLVAKLRPARVHLLGVGVKNADAYSDAVLWNSPETILSSDANRVRAFIGKGRQITERVEAAVEAVFEQELEQEIDGTDFEGYLHNFPGYLDPAEARELARLYGITAEDEIAKWGRWSQEAATERFTAEQEQKSGLFEEWSFDCKIGYALMLADPYGYETQRLVYGRGHDELKEMLAKLAADRRRSEARQKAITNVMSLAEKRRERENHARRSQGFLFTMAEAV